MAAVTKNRNFFNCPLQLGGHLGWKSGSSDTFWKGAIQGPFHQSLVQIGPVAFEELIKM
jgi:hypothetical protein